MIAFINRKTYSILNVRHAHKTSMMVGHIVAGRSEVVRTEGVVIDEPKKQSFKVGLRSKKKTKFILLVEHFEVVAFDKELGNVGKPEKNQESLLILFLLLVVEKQIDKILKVIQGIIVHILS